MGRRIRIDGAAGVVDDRSITARDFA